MFAETFVSLVALLGIYAAQAEPVPAAPVVLRTLPTAKYVVGPMAVPVKNDPTRIGIETTSRSAMVMDVPTGKVLFEKEAQRAYPIASLTKLLTAMTVLDSHPDMSEEGTILAEDDPHEGKAVFPIGERFQRTELLKGLLIGSVNIAGNTLARMSGDRESFVDAMNAKAQELGMLTSHFVDPTGLSPENRASARDVALMMRAALQYPEIRAITKQGSLSLIGRATGKPYAIRSTNLLLDSFLNKSPYEVVAGKTGSLPEAGFCFAQATRDKDQHEVIAVVLGSNNHFARFQEVKALTYWTFENYTWQTREFRGVISQVETE